MPYGALRTLKPFQFLPSRVKALIIIASGALAGPGSWLLGWTCPFPGVGKGRCRLEDDDDVMKAGLANLAFWTSQQSTTSNIPERIPFTSGTARPAITQPQTPQLPPRGESLNYHLSPCSLQPRLAAGHRFNTKGSRPAPEPRRRGGTPIRCEYLLRNFLPRVSLVFIPQRQESHLRTFTPSHLENRRTNLLQHHRHLVSSPPANPVFQTPSFSTLVYTKYVHYPPFPQQEFGYQWF